MRLRFSASLIASCLLPAAAAAQSSTSFDAMVQAPQLKAPERGSVVGHYSGVAIGPGDVTRGAFTLPSPLTAPSERGGLLASVFPVYSPEAGLSEWGMGWQTSLALTRTRVRGELDFLPLATTGDDLSGPFGRLVRGTDGNFYPLGLSRPIRVVPGADTLTAYLPDGTKMSFGAVKVTRARGTYAWQLTEVASVTGRKTRLDWVFNASGRPFLAAAWYGGVGDAYAYRIDFQYDVTPTPFDDFRGGDVLSLDRRVGTITMAVKHPQTGAFTERWRHVLGYQAEGLGPAFYLSSVQQVFRSGARPPATRYTYHLAKDWLDRALLAASGTAEFDPLGNAVRILDELGYDALQPDRTRPFDEDMDGRGDLEHHWDNRLARQTSAGVVFEQLAVAAAPDPRCYKPPSPYNPPRLLANVFGDDRTYVMDISQSVDLARTDFVVCERSGEWVGAASPEGSWIPGAITRLVDIDRDHRPDIVKVEAGYYQIALNQSVGRDVAFVDARYGALTPAVTPETAWVHDMNGDALPDLVARASDTLWVWFGKGNLEFTEGQEFPFATPGGSVIGGISAFALTFVDANKDGLTDVLLADAWSTYLHINRGSYFQETVVPGLSGVPGISGPAVVDVSGSGNPEAVWYGPDPSTGTGQAWGVPLAQAETGLLATADDGKGTVLSFEYGRAPAARGGRQRQAVLSRFTVTSSGQAPVSYSYDYLLPKVHGAGKFLLGYDEVLRTAPLGSDWAQFLNTDHYAGVALASSSSDTLVPGLQRYSQTTYDDAVIAGLPWKRTAQVEAGWRSTDGTSRRVAEVSRTTGWSGVVCPAQVVKETSAGKLTIDRQYATPAAFNGHLSCLAANVTETGRHPDASLNFTHRTVLTRNAVGLVTRVSSAAGADVLTLQDVTYTSDWLVQTISAPGAGTTTSTYDPATRLLQRVTAPDGHVIEAIARDPLTGTISALRTTHGRLVHDQWFGFDQQERLERSWDDTGSGTQASPDVRFAYRFATATTPAAITAGTLVDPGAWSTTVDLLGAGGKTVVSARRIPEGWALGTLTWRDGTTGQTASYLRTRVGGDALSGLDYTTLFAGTRLAGRTTAGPFGITRERLSMLHADVQRTLAESLWIDPSSPRLLRNVRENGAVDQTSATDEAGHVTTTWDEAGTAWGFVHDVLGRLRVVQLPGGKQHRTTFDGHRRPSRVMRDGVATVEYVYEPTTGLLGVKRFLGASGTLLRTVTLTHDGIGRIAREDHADVAAGTSKSFRFYFDGATPEDPTATTAKGLVTAVSGDGYVKRFTYRGDGLITRRVLELGSWRRIVIDLSYGEDGSTAGQTVSVYSGAQLLTTSAALNRLDTYGRLRTISFRDGSAATFSYNDEGRIGSVALPGGSFTPEYDAFTTTRAGAKLATPAFTAVTRQRLNARALPDSELLQVGSTSLTRAYGYSARRFLERSTDARSTSEYSFAADGLPSRIVENGVGADLVATGKTLVAGNVTYVFDDLGRTVKRGDLVLAYGADGELARATRGTAAWTFLHDEKGNRLAKLEQGVPVAAYLEAGYLEATQLVEPVTISGQLVGVLRNGVFEAVAGDLRGTVLAEKDGTPRIASPFGKRSAHPTIAAAVDYVNKGFDTDLGLVRMGVRDYDPLINRFTTPDPLYLERPQRCVANVVACNLYSYASNAPTTFVDPSGTDEEPVHGVLMLNLLKGAGVNAERAADIAYASAGLDYDPRTEPVKVTNIVTGVTNDKHFNPQSHTYLRAEIAAGARNSDALGAYLHQTTDAGHPDAPGVHVAGLRGPTGHPFAVYKDADGSISIGTPFNHYADHPYRHPELSRAVLQKVAHDIYSIAKARGEAGDYDLYMKYANEQIERVLGTTTRGGALDYARQSGYFEAMKDAASRNGNVHQLPLDDGKTFDCTMNGAPTWFDKLIDWFKAGSMEPATEAPGGSG